LRERLIRRTFHGFALARAYIKSSAAPAFRRKQKVLTVRDIIPNYFRRDKIGIMSLQLQQHGPEDAVLVTAKRTDALLDSGDVEGQRVW
jgi:hypothetical protein